MSRDTIEFIKAAIRRPMDVSTIFPTSKSLAETMLSFADIERAAQVVELGAGTGAITKYIAPRLAQKSNYLGIELDTQMVDFLKQEFNGLKFETGLAQDLTKWVAPGSVDYVVSSLPWTVFSTEIQTKTIEAIIQSLKPGGSFLTYVCANALLYPQAKSLIHLLHENFTTVKRSRLEWRNIPPAFVYHSVK